MDRQILNFTVNEQNLNCENPIRISTNKVNYIQANFDLGTNWDGYDSVRAIWFNDFNCISTVLDSLGNCAVPFEVMKRKGNVKVNLVGSISEDDVLTDRLTSYPVVAVIVDCTAQITGANTSPITPSEYEQFVAAVHEDAERAEAGATASEQSAQNAHTSEQNASNSAQSAHDDKIAIEEAIAEVIQQIADFEQVQVVVNTLPPSSQATSDFTNGVLTLGIPQGVKGDTGNGIQSIAKVSTSGLVDTYRITYTDGQTTTFTVTNGAKGDTGNGIQSIAKTSTVGLVDTYTITYTDGTTSTFTVTNGEKGDKGDQGEVSLSELEDATIVQTLSDTEPYNSRRTNNGNGSGHREYDEIVGASVGWNQLVNWDNITRTKYGVTGTISNNRLIFNGTATATDWTATFGGYVDTNVSPVEGHKYYVCGLKKSSDDAYVTVGGKSDGVYPLTFADVWRFYVKEGVTYTNYTFEINIFDLTLFNSAIADYVYTLEQGTAGSGVTWLKTHFPKLFDNGYQPFDSGSIKSVSGLTAHEMVGVNAWDEEWEVGGISTSNGANINQQRLRSKNYIPLIVGETYNFLNTPRGNLSVYWYDENKVFEGSESLGTALNVAFFPQYPYMRFVEPNITAYSNDICINLSDTSINGQYFPYEKHTYPLDSSVTLRGKYVLDNGQLKAVGDVWKSVGEIERNWDEYTITGNEGWLYYSSQDYFYTNVNIGAHKHPASDLGNAIMAEYTEVGSFGSSTPDKSFVLNSNAHTANNFYIKDTSYNGDLAAFKAGIAGKKVAFLRATPTTENADPYTNPQLCEYGGTEEYIGSELPVGHNTDYPMTMVDCADGLSNGTYTPKLTVTNGKLTFEWQSV